MNNQSDSSTSVLEVDDLRVNLGRYTALADISFRAQPGQTIAIVGPNGAGKSTLMHAILGLLPFKSGRIKVHGKPPDSSDPILTGYVPQLKRLDRSFPAITCELVASGLTMRWPVRLGRRTHQQVEQALEMVGAPHLSHKPLHWLSGGEYQRVYIARALIRQPKLLLLDEPATGIDALGEDDLYRYLEQYQRETDAAIVVITHDWLAARHHASHALLLNRRQYGFGPVETALIRNNLVELFGHRHHEHSDGVSFV